ncbi:ACT domain-containing protein ACR1 isoform X2 [Magnolia sinica]|nr:ACT domain-containing protein ACR1 isoform X2 [Magnolia sinica]XP_058081965.1 ACT domain-containing protein ACR1 isoform X2 [Magnolia sinica]XP_058081966.1 ACT domain-containing protein ACR1 isoform X2 [Magnolia sinica]XP_058081967.1 ACT domain-containing protein ACR1 isoform X2 [Magnolia sinica]
MESYRPYYDPEIESLIERIHPPRVCIDNDTCEDCTLVKVDSANKHGILLEMVQVLTDLDLVISKSYISSDGGWFMDVFHVTDQLGNKLSDESLIHYIKQALCPGRKGAGSESVRTCLGRLVGPRDVVVEHTALEMTGSDRPGLLSDISAVLVELGCQVVAAEAWTHNGRAACIIYITDAATGGAISDGARLAHVEEQLENVVGAHHLVAGNAGGGGGAVERRVRVAGPTESRTHTERRLHQLMFTDRDYEEATKVRKTKTDVSIESWREKGYSVLNVRCRDRPKLLFDTVCTLTDMEYVVFHAAISSRGSLAVQEYYIRHVDGCTLDTESERRRVTQCLIAAVERRVSHGLRLDVCTNNRVGLLSDITRVFRENGLSVSRAEISTRGDTAVGTFFVTDASGNEADHKTVESVSKEMGGTVLVINNSPTWVPTKPRSSAAASTSTEDRPRFSLGSLLWSQLERLSSNFGSIRS